MIFGNNLIKTLFALVLAASLAGCAAKNDVDTKRDVRELYEAAKEKFYAERFEESEKLFKAILEDYPLSSYSTEAQLMLGDLNYEQDKFEDASSFYTSFAAYHPSHPRADYALFQKGMSHMKDMLPPDRDQASAKKALFAFQDLLDAYPQSQYAQRAAELASAIKKRLAERELLIGRFYFKKGNYKGALSRLRNVLKEYPETAAVEDALFYIGESYAYLGEAELSSEAFNALLQNFPNSQHRKRAEHRLHKSNG